MGWTGVSVQYLGWDYKKKTYDRKGYLDKECNCENDTYKWEVLKSAMVGTTWYGAIKRTSKATGKFEVYGETILTSLEHYEFCYKEVSEDMGPYTYECPAGILNLLTPTDDKWANEWREKCRATARLKAYKAKWWKTAQDKSKVKYIKYTLPFDINTYNLNDQSDYLKGTEVYLTYNQYVIRSKLMNCWTDGFYRFKKSLIRMENCVFVSPDGSEFTMCLPQETMDIINRDYSSLNVPNNDGTPAN